MSRKKKFVQRSYWDFNQNKNVHATLLKFTGKEMDEVRSEYKIGHYAIRWIVKGNISGYIDHRPIDVKPNLFFLGNPAQISKFDMPEDQEVQMYVIAFTERFIGKMNLGEGAIELLFSLAKDFEMYPKGHDRDALQKLFELIIFEFESGPEDLREGILANLVKSVLQYAYRFRTDQPEDKRNRNYFQIYKKFLSLLEIHYKSKQTVGEYADMIFIHVKQLNRACKAMTNLPSSKIIQKRIDVEAKSMLIGTDLSTKQIGYELGFKDSAYFSNFFKKINQTTPGRFRRQIN